MAIKAAHGPVIAGTDDPDTVRGYNAPGSPGDFGANQILTGFSSLSWSLYGLGDYTTYVETETEIDDGSDAIFGGLGNDQLFGGGNDDFLFGGAGNSPFDGSDKLFGGWGDDLLVAGNAGRTTDGGADRLNGGPGNDTMFGADGDDVIIGGDGIDTAEYVGNTLSNFSITFSTSPIPLFDGRFVLKDERAPVFSDFQGSDILDPIELIADESSFDFLAPKWGESARLGTSSGVVTWSLYAAGGEPIEYLDEDGDFSSFVSNDLGFLGFDVASVVSELESAFKVWSSVADIKFTKSDADGLDDMSATDPPDIKIYFATSGNNTLGVAARPDYEYSENIDNAITDLEGDVELTLSSKSGDILFDTNLLDDSLTDYDKRQSTFIHEIGHAIGLNHIDEVGTTFGALSIMEAETADGEFLTELQPVDIEYVQKIYGPGSDPVIIDGDDGDDELSASLDEEIINLYDGVDFVYGTPEELDGDTIFGFGFDDTLVFTDVSFGLSNVAVTFGSAILDIDADLDGEFETQVVLEGDYENVAFDVAQVDGNTEITITEPVDENTPPVATNDGGAGFETNEDTAFTTGSVLVNDDDDDGDTLSVTSLDTTGTLGLVVDNGDGTFDYDPDSAFEDLSAGETTTDSFGYEISDGNGGTSTATVTISIAGVEDEILPNLIGGTAGSDNLVGKGSADAIRSLAGSYDKMRGGTEADQFIFGSEVSNGVRERDVILDYEAGIDEIVLEDGASVGSIRQTSSQVVVFFEGDRDAVYVRGDGVTADNIAIVADGVFEIV